MPNANDSLDPAAMLESILEIKSAIGTTTSRVQELVRERAAATSAASRESRAAEESATQRTQARIVALAGAHRQLREQVEARFASRHTRIHDAFHQSRTSLGQRLQTEKDRRVGRAQGEIVRAREQRAADLDHATRSHREFQQVLTENRQRRIALRDSALDGLRSFRPIVAKPFRKPVAETDEQATSGDHSTIHARSIEALDAAEASIATLRSQPLVRLFRLVPLSLLLACAAGIHLFLAFRPGGGGIWALWPFMAVTLSSIMLLWTLALVLVLPLSRKAASQLATARAFAIESEKSSAANLAAISARLKAEDRAQSNALGDTFRDSDETRQQQMAAGFRKLDQQLARLPAKLERLRQRTLARLDEQHQRSLALIHQETATLDHARHAAFDAALEQARKTCADAIRDLVPGWQAGPVSALYHLRALDAASLKLFPQWTAHSCSDWTPPASSPAAIRIGHLEIIPSTLAGTLPEAPELSIPTLPLVAPLALAFPHHASLLIESADGTGSAELAAVSLRLLASFPAGRSSFVFIDPVGLGKDFAGLMHLADYEETLIHHRIWTQQVHIEERLAELNEHIEKVIQMFLRNEFATLAEYNSQAGVIAEKHHFVVIAGFPAGFSDTACKRLLAIASSGARCGVHLLVHHDLRQPPPDPTLLDEIRRSCLRVTHEAGRFCLTCAPPGADILTFDPPPSPEDTTTLVHLIGRAAIDSNRVEVPFSHIAPSEEELWSLKTNSELRVPIGRAGAKKIQMLALGKGTRQHALVAGKTGSGKSTLFHVIITNLALWCSPDEVEFYLVDFKKGVEFKCYANKHLPHARVIAIESDRGFALSVLQRIDAELKHRGELFRRAGSQDLPSYLDSPGAITMPRCLLLIDEFQEFFTEDDPVAQEASLLLDRIVRQGRAFGIHVILGSQTLGGAYTLARATLGQMVVRVALQCNEADAALIMEDDNPAPRLLNRPGEGIYNDQAGALAANSPFQIVWLPERERDARLDLIRELSARSGRNYPPPVVFEDNAPADLADNPELQNLLARPPAVRPAAARVWLGAPNSIKGHTEAVFERRNGSHLLVVGQSVERNATVLGIAVTSLAAQFPPGTAEFFILDSSPTPSFLQTSASTISHPVRIAGPSDSAPLLADLTGKLRQDDGDHDSPARFLIIHQLERFKSLKPDDEFAFLADDSAPSPSRALADILNEGGPAGIHVIAGIDTWNNISRWIPRKLLAEFEMRVLFQMSAGDSANLIDSPAASSLGLHRALLHNEHLGTQETFRPYAQPG